MGPAEAENHGGHRRSPSSEMLQGLLVGDSTFWEAQVRSPANTWMAMGGRGTPRNAEETFLRRRQPIGGGRRTIYQGETAREEAQDPSREGRTSSTASWRGQHLGQEG